MSLFCDGQATNLPRGTICARKPPRWVRTGSAVDHQKPMFTTNPFDDDKLREECGIFGVFNAETASAMVALGLHALQHRGQEAAGITSSDGHDFPTHRATGHVAGNFHRADVIRVLPGPAACAHVPLSTTA